MTTIITRGSVSAQALGYAAPSLAANYIEDVFSTYLYAGNGGTQTITNNVDLSTKGGLVWIKNRTLAAGHALTDTARGAGTGTNKASTNILQSNSTGGTGGGLPASSNDYLSAFTTTGFTVVSSNGANDGTKVTNRSSSNYVAWTFRKQAKFFDIVTYTGTGANRTISHSLGSAPGCIIVKRTDATIDWAVYHKDLGNNIYVTLNSTASALNSTTYWNNTAPTSSVFSVGTATETNANGGTYVAYLFASDAGGFGSSGTNNVITCGSYTGNASPDGPTVTLGYEPQWILAKNTGTGGAWILVDNMRGMSVSNNTPSLSADTTGAEATSVAYFGATATGFKVRTDNVNVNDLDANIIYIAIRRGPMKAPTSGTSVYYSEAVQDTNNQFTTGFPVDLVIDKYGYRDASQSPISGVFYVYDRLRGPPNNLDTTQAAGDSTTQPAFYVTTTGFQRNTTLGVGPGDGTLNNDYAKFWTFCRAPSFLDIVCYSGTGANATQTHNLGVIPELMIIKNRSFGASSTAWQVYSASLAATEYLVLNTTAAKATGATRWNSTRPTASVFSIGTDPSVNGNAGSPTYIAYLFASCAGVSKVGSYTGTGALQTVNCGFSSGARFVLIKRADSTGDWYLYDSAQGISSSNDPYVTINTGNPQITNTNYVDTDTTGFKVTAAAPAGLNASGGTYIFLAVA